jgi:hypothetical protein
MDATALALFDIIAGDRSLARSALPGAPVPPGPLQAPVASPVWETAAG